MYAYRFGGLKLAALVVVLSRTLGSAPLRVLAASSQSATRSQITETTNLAPKARVIAISLFGRKLHVRAGLLVEERTEQFKRQALELEVIEDGDCAPLHCG
jgi:hypothetical protein